MKNLLLFQIFFLFYVLILVSSNAHMKNNQVIIDNADYTVTKVTRRDATYYTQGLFFNEKGNHLYESGGMYGNSVLVKYEYPSLKEIKKIKLQDKYFGEGLARCGDYVYQLTWRERDILKYSFPELIYVDKLSLDSNVNEGWGLAEGIKSNELIATDGSSKIYFLDCENQLNMKKTIEIKYNGSTVPYLNALIYAEGHFWANQYLSHYIYKIDPSSGQVVKRYNMSDLSKFEIEKNTLSNYRLRNGEVLNGIAYDKVNKKFLLTGKLWGYFYEVNFK